MPLLAVLALKKIFDDPSILKREKWSFYLSGGIVGGLPYWRPCSPVCSMIDDELEAIQQPGYGELFAGIAEARRAIFTADAWRSFVIVALGFVALWLLGEEVRFDCGNGCVGRNSYRRYVSGGINVISIAVTS